jgi:CubicO group peptidase (beta-lactamase class C family)
MSRRLGTCSSAWFSIYLVFGLVLFLSPDAVWAQALTRDKVGAALPTLEAMAQRVVNTGEVPGLAIVVVYNDEAVYLKGFGLREVGKAETVDADTVFQLASLSKPVSSSVVAALVTEGIIEWDSRIADLDPGFALYDAYPTSQVTLRDLFNHRSGLPGGAGDDLEEIGYEREEILRRLRLVPPSSSFRAGYSYSNFGLTEGGVAAAKPTGKSWEVVAEEKLFKPLGMTVTSARHADFLKHPNRSALHVRVNGVWTAKLKRDPDAQAPAGGISSSARDLVQWLRLELGSRKYDGVSAASLDETHVPLMARGSNPLTGAASFYGLGWNVEFGRHGISWGHAGAFSVGARTLVTIYPKSNLGIIVLSNAFPTGVPEGLSDSFADLVFDGKIEKDWVKGWNEIYDGLFGPAVAAAKAAYAMPPASATPALPLASYTAQYANDYTGDAVVANENGTLTLTVGPGGVRRYAMRHFDRDLFLYFPDAEMPDKPSAARFTIGADGKASAITLESLDDNGFGTLKRVDETRKR